MEGTRIGNYRVVRLVGRGGMGAVYEAVHESLSKRAAIKVLHAHFAQDPQLAARFSNEARALTSMDHPGIVQVFDFGVVDGTPYIAMEFLNGEPLSKRLKRHHPSPLPLPMALRLCRQMATALATAHSHHVVHRDLKPGNVMIVADPEAAAGERVKLFDFGIAKLLTPRPTSEDLHHGDYETRTGMLMGTPTYMSPEQCRGDAAVDDRTDVYALGVILYQMLAGRPPFFGGGDGEVIAAHIYAAPAALRSFDASIPDEVEGLVFRLLAKQPDARPRMAEVAAQLEALGVKATGVLSALVVLPPGDAASRRSPVTGGPSSSPPSLAGGMDPLAPLGGPITSASLAPLTGGPGTQPSFLGLNPGDTSARSGSRPSWAPGGAPSGAPSGAPASRASDSAPPSTLGLAQAGPGLEARPGRGVGRPPLLLWALAAVGTVIPTAVLLQRECAAPPVAVSLPPPPGGGAPGPAGMPSQAPAGTATPPGAPAGSPPTQAPPALLPGEPARPAAAATPSAEPPRAPAGPTAIPGERPLRPTAESRHPRHGESDSARGGEGRKEGGEGREPSVPPAAPEVKPPPPEEPRPHKGAPPVEPPTAPPAGTKPSEPRAVEPSAPPPPTRAEDKPRNVLAGVMRAQKVSGASPSLPPALRLQVRDRGSLVVSYRLCVDRAGRVTTVNRFGGSPPAGTDEVVTPTLKAWAYQPQAVPVCFIETFHFEVD